MGRVRGSRRDPRKDEYGKISRRCRRHNWKDCHLEFWRWRSQVLYLAQWRGGGSTLALGDLTSTLRVAMASSMETTWRGSMDSFYLGQEGSEIKFGVLNAEMGLRRMNVRRCSVPLGRERLVNQRSAMSKRLKLSDLAKVVAQKAATSASKGVVTSEGSETTSGKRPLDDGSKGKQVAQSPEPKKARIDTGASVMASAATAEKILAGVILPADKEKVDKLTFDQVVTKFIHALGQGVILGSSLAVRSRDFAESALNRKAVAESAKIEMVRAQNRAIELEGALAEEKAKGKKLAEDADARSKVIAKLEARISELEKSQSLTQGRIIAAFKESDDFLEALAHQYPDLGVDLEDVEMDHEFLAKEEAEAEQRAAEEGAAGAEGSAVPCMFTKINLRGEESEQSLPSWISDHLGAKSYIDETSQSPSSPPPNSPKMDTSSLTKEGIRLRIPGDGETILSARQGEVAFYEATFQAGLRLPIHPTIREILVHYKICPAQLSPNAWRSVICSLARPDKNLLRGSPSNVKGWKTRFFFASGSRVGVPFGHGRQQYSASSQILGNAKSVVFFFFCKSLWSPDMRFSGKSCNKLPTLSEVDAKRTEAILGKIEPGGYFKVSKVLGSRTFNKYFAVGCTALSTSGGDNTTSGDEGEFVTREDSVEYLGVIRRDIGGVVRRARPGIPDETLLRWLGGKVKDPFTNLLSGTSGSTMSARAGAPAFGEKTGGKAKATKATTAKPPTKGIVIQEKRTREGVPVVEIGGPDSSKGKEAAPPPAPKRFKSNRGAINARGPVAGAGTSSPGCDVGSESISDASVARRLLTGVIPASDKEEVDRLSENDLVAKSFHALGQAKELAIEDFKASGEFKAAAAVTDFAATYFSEGFEFCKRQLLHQFPNLGVDVANMAMDPSFAEEEEAMNEGEDPVSGVAPNV
ncbi:hypothetical protein Acr_19g0002360 [Actinidia rufa]|uniref:Transposase (putative) gypsy type domain-containing protein n=1 Tax=Actinidia rufa TaxID=165716 RepID=A0A7J0G930_9ERIC|nr:hypothetical protein Acr_19g0002360 [Actinidia rufa]